MYETSILRVLVNSDNKDDYHLVFQTTDQSLIDGTYRWHFRYYARERRITLAYAKEGTVTGNWAMRMLLNETMATNNANAVKMELETLKRYIVEDIIDDWIKVKLG